jgi:hypothetical protein
MAKHLCSGAAAAPETQAAIVATRAILLRDCVFASNVRASPDPHNQTVHEDTETNKTSESNKCWHPAWHRWRHLTVLHSSEWLGRNIHKHIHGVVENRKDHHDLERRKSPRTVAGGVAGPTETHARHYLAQSEVWAAGRHAAAWVASSLDAAVADSVSPCADRGTIFPASTPAILTDYRSMEVLSFPNTACGLQMENEVKKRCEKDGASKSTHGFTSSRVFQGSGHIGSGHITQGIAWHTGT